MIQSQIDGEFAGWEGETVVRLVNGQVWQQSEYWYHYHYAYMPKVTITRDGGYKMQVAGVPRAASVGWGERSEAQQQQENNNTNAISTRKN